MGAFTPNKTIFLFVFWDFSPDVYKNDVTIIEMKRLKLYN